MTMQRRPNNPIEQRKQDVRKYSRNGAISVAAGIGGGVLAAFVLSGSSWFWLSLGLIFAVVAGGYNFMKVNKLVNENHNRY